MARADLRIPNNDGAEFPESLCPPEETSSHQPNQSECHQDEPSSRNKPSEQQKGRRREFALKKDVLPEQDLDKGIVGWEGQDDPENPRNYTTLRKWTILSLVSSMTMIRLVHHSSPAR